MTNNELYIEIYKKVIAVVERMDLQRWWPHPIKTIDDLARAARNKGIEDVTDALDRYIDTQSLSDIHNAIIDQKANKEVSTELLKQFILWRLWDVVAAVTDEESKPPMLEPADDDAIVDEEPPTLEPAD